MSVGFIISDELEEFLLRFKNQIGSESYEKIEGVLRKNDFTSRLALKLLTTENLDEMLVNCVPLGARKILDYNLDILKNESPLILKISGKYDQCKKDSLVGMDPSTSRMIGHHASSEASSAVCKNLRNFYDYYSVHVSCKHKFVLVL